MNNADRITALDSLRKRKDLPPWMHDQSHRGFDDIGWTLLLIAGSTALGLTIAIGLWNAAQTPALDDYTRETVAECQAQGYVATVERSQSGAVLAVRCNKRSDVIRP